MKTLTKSIDCFRNLCPSTLNGIFTRIIEVCGTAEEQTLHTGSLGFTTEIQRQEVNLRKLTQAGTNNPLYNPLFMKELVEWVMIDKKNRTYTKSKVAIDRLMKVAKESHFLA